MGSIKRLAADDQGIYRSEIFRGLWLDAQALKNHLRTSGRCSDYPAARHWLGGTCRVRPASGVCMPVWLMYRPHVPRSSPDGAIASDFSATTHFSYPCATSRETEFRIESRAIGRGGDYRNPVLRQHWFSALAREVGGAFDLIHAWGVAAALLWVAVVCRGRAESCSRPVQLLSAPDRSIRWLAAAMKRRDICISLLVYASET